MMSKLINLRWRLKFCRTILQIRPRSALVQPTDTTLIKMQNCFKMDENDGLVVPCFKKALLYADKLAIKDSFGDYTYLQLFLSAKKLAFQLSNLCNSASSKHIAYLCPRNILSPLVQWACWMSGQVAIPLNINYPVETLKFFVHDTKTYLIIASPLHEMVASALAEHLDIPLIIIDHAFVIPSYELPPNLKRIALVAQKTVLIEGALSNDFYTNSNAMILFTSGSTGKVKSVVLTHKNVDAQIRSLTTAWQLDFNDSLLHILPLNHIYGCQALMCMLSVGGRIIMPDTISTHKLWSTILAINAPAKDHINLFMGTPSIYEELLMEYEKIFAKNSRMAEYIANFCKKHIRLMVSGNVPMKTETFIKWLKITKHRILEHYTITEVGTALSNPYIEDTKLNIIRRPGTIGTPLPKVKIRLISAENKELLVSSGNLDNEESTQQNSSNDDANFQGSSAIPALVGELQIDGPGVFKEYYKQARCTSIQMSDGFFKTGDVVEYRGKSFNIIGRVYDNILKIGDHLVYACEIEACIKVHPNVNDVVVLKAPDEDNDDAIAALCILKDPKDPFAINDIIQLCTERLPTFKHPTKLKIIETIPKATRKKLREMYFNDKEKEENNSINTNN